MKGVQWRCREVEKWGATAFADAQAEEKGLSRRAAVFLAWDGWVVGGAVR